MVLVLALPKTVAAYIQARALLHPGERVVVAVSGGADSVGLLRLLLDLRGEMGLVISVAHFHHGIRGADADADAEFVADLARSCDFEFHFGRGDARQASRENNVSLEAAGRALRQEFFAELLQRGKANVIATAHTLDDQAETVLMKLLRGAGSRGLAGIFPEQKLKTGRIIRPLLEVRREQIRDYLRELDQIWREDQSNSDESFLRNRVRSRVLPMLREQINPAADRALAHAAEIARADEEYWDEQVKRLLPLVALHGEPTRGGGRAKVANPRAGAHRFTSDQGISFDIEKLKQFPLALQRRLLRSAAEQTGCALDFEHLQAILDLCAHHSPARNGTIELANKWRARRLFREVRLERDDGRDRPKDYEYVLPVPGDIRLVEVGLTIRTRIREDNGTARHAAYNRAHLIPLVDSIETLTVRNWRAGDRFQAAQHRSEKRLKELLYELRLGEEEKRLWPVVAMGSRILWVRGIDSPELRMPTGEMLSIEASTE